MRCVLPAKMRAAGRALAWTSLVFTSASAMSCFSEINFGWCEYSQTNPHDPPSCPEYVFSIASFQRKLDAHYNDGGRPPLMEAFFLIRLHDMYKQNLIDSDCPNPLILAGMLVGEFHLVAPSWENLEAAGATVLSYAQGGEFMLTPEAVDAFVLAASKDGRLWYDDALALAKSSSPFQQHLMAAKPPAWPLRKAIERVQAAQDRLGDMAPMAMSHMLLSRGRGRSMPSGRPCPALELRPWVPPAGWKPPADSTGTPGAPLEVPSALQTACWDADGVDRPRRVDFVVAHCREPLDWLGKKLEKVPPGSVLYLYEKCGGKTSPEELSRLAQGKFQAVRVVQRADIGLARGDECSAYLSHIVSHHSSDRLADFTVFLQSDPMDHLHFEFLDLVLRSIAAGTYAVPFLPLNGPRHVRTLTPCLQAVHEEIFGFNLTDLIGPYCCAQFAVSREAIQKRSWDFYAKMLSLVDGSRNVDLCGVEGTKRSTQCYGFEFLWHIVFGEDPDPPGREDDLRLPVALRLKHGKEHTRRNWIGVPLARDIPLKIVPDHEHGNPMHLTGER